MPPTPGSANPTEEYIVTAPTIDPTIRQGELREHELRIVGSYDNALLEWHANLGDNGQWTATLSRGALSRTADGLTVAAAVLSAHDSQA